ncbi:VOC family protein [Lacrimispora sp. NSJ-141]|uniref:VOC family protein n=1 Tax=Lientehia hominis TaxID=2897778 RepID=A0AAP2W9Q1_9FIRM|nr:VOC family protein [Lientehia hominis]MCD2492177.1 VOC family protein [Lientehia hominis]
MGTNHTFHHIALRAADYENTLAFYCGGIGCRLAYEWQGDDGRCCMVDIGGGDFIEIYEGGEEGLPEDFEKRSGCFFHLAIGVENTDETYESAIKAGAVSRDAPFDTVIQSVPPLLIRIAFVYGPDGELIEFFKVR